MHPRSAPVVGLKGPLALGHGCLLVACGNPVERIGLDGIAVGKLFVSLANRRGLRDIRVAAVSPRSGDCSRVLTRFP
jgi:hypothetical protein